MSHTNINQKREIIICNNCKGFGCNDCDNTGKKLLITYTLETKSYTNNPLRSDIKINHNIKDHKEKSIEEIKENLKEDNNIPNIPNNDNNQTYLTLDIISKYNFKTQIKQFGNGLNSFIYYSFITPNNLYLEAYKTKNTVNLYAVSLDYNLKITTKEELDNILSKSYNDILIDIGKQNPNFNITKYKNDNNNNIFPL